VKVAGKTWGDGGFARKELAMHSAESGLRYFDPIASERAKNADLSAALSREGYGSRPHALVLIISGWEARMNRWCRR
jgi:hypothetical protein